MGAIVMLRDNPELCKELGANGRRAYEGRYSWEIMEQRLITLYQELIGLRRR
jgi:glycosyltransferase involved in cell wall biosynthesis